MKHGNGMEQQGACRASHGHNIASGGFICSVDASLFENGKRLGHVCVATKKFDLIVAARCILLQEVETRR